MELAGKRILVTGADGFIGSHLVERLVGAGVASVSALCVYNSNGSYGWLDQLDSETRSSMDLILGDIRDARLVRESARGADIIFHLAALISIPYSYQAPASFVETNTIGTLNVLEAARDLGTVRVVHTSTSEVYGTPDKLPIRETHPNRAQSPYAASKLAADHLCESYARSFGVDVLVMRPFNTYGPRQSLRAIVPTILTQLIAGHKRISLGSVHPRRDLTYVADTVQGFLLMAQSDLPSGAVVQLGTGRTVSIGELFDLCCQITDTEAKVVVDPMRVRPSASEVEVLVSDPSKARESINWWPERTLEDGLRETKEWLKSYVDEGEASRYYT